MWQRYFAYSLYYDLLGVWLLSAPFFLLWLILYRRPLASPAWRVVGKVQAAVLTLNLLFSQFDHEIVRFLGVRLNFSFLATYGQPQILSDNLFLDVLLSDHGGPFVGVLLLFLVPAGYGWWAFRLLRRTRAPGPRRPPAIWLALLIFAVPLAAPANAWIKATGKFRLRKTEAVVLALASDIALGYEDFEAPEDYDRLARDYQRRWLAASGDRNWRFPDPERPYLRVPVGPPPPPDPGPRWNVIYLQLETFRGVDMGFLRPDRTPSPTPYLDRFVQRPDSASWTRALSFGIPSINGLFAVHCSVAPHSRRYMTGFTDTAFSCLPDTLRRRGYRAEIFNAGDTDWDNSTPWLTRWYDRLWRYPQAGGQDRYVFRAAARRIRDLGRSGRPFFATVVSASNHSPFVSPEPAFDMSGHATLAESVLNSTHYTDDVVREFIEALRGEPWFERTLVVMAGDHGFNTGEHGQSPGQHDLYRESVWVPLIFAGAHPRLVHGTHGRLASLLDLAPTIADLLGIREANAWQGHSLLAPGASDEEAFAMRDSILAETGLWTALLDPYDGRPRLFDARRDWLQRHDLAGRRPGLTEALLRRAGDAQRLHNYLLRRDRIWRNAPPPP